ncbi:MAG: hypothetical protein K0B06_08990 [Brevefilum sp.]|nr:hypothetical protein [Brevefilum sp.]
MAQTVQGIAHTWQLSDSPIGSGDAGEVYAVTCLDQPDLTGMMKKPARIATAGTIQRQAGQIAREAQALARLDGLPTGKAHPPRLLDQAPEFTLGTAHYFIISETALGQDLSSLLIQIRQTGKPFPRRVIMTVLDALFDMFSRAHKAGVLWNDVKLDHIYWHNPTGKIGVIDWGNALFLDSDDRQTPPRWVDYQQMIDTLGDFLKRNAPDLYVDLGWEEFHDQTLDSSRVSVLARRISYQQQVIALQMMEYQSLVRVILNADPSLEGLRKILDFKQILEKIGASWSQEGVLEYSQSLVTTALAEGDRQTTVSGTALVWEIFDDSLDLPWHLLREYCRHTDILTHAAFPSLAKHTLKAQWSDALWAASTIASHIPVPDWWDRLIPVMRQTALATAALSPYQAGQNLLKWAQNEGQVELTGKLAAILRAWRTTGTDLERSPFDYALLDIIRENQDLPSRLRSEIKQSFAPGEEAIRELIKLWQNSDWDALPKSFRRVIAWDPDRWGILTLAEQLNAFQAWCQSLHQGPKPGVNPNGFFADLVENRPKVEHLLGTPPWLKSLLTMLNAISQDALISTYQAEVNRYCPWLLAYFNLGTAEARQPQVDESTLHHRLSHFVGHLKSWSDIDTGLADLQVHAPQVYALCNRLVDGFNMSLALNANLDYIKTITAGSLPPELIETGQVLQSMVSWREYLADQDLPGAIQSLSGQPVEDWALTAHARLMTLRWQDAILPILDAILSINLAPGSEERPADPQLMLLQDISTNCIEITALWQRIFTSGPHADLLASLETEIEQNRSSFMRWRSAFENASDRVELLLYHNHLTIIRQLSSRMMRMATHIRQARLAFSTLGEGDQASKALQNKNIENILYHLAAIEADLVPDQEHRRFPGFLRAFKHIIEADASQSPQALIADLPEDHPFYAWLVKSTLA